MMFGLTTRKKADQQALLLTQKAISSVFNSLNRSYSLPVWGYNDAGDDLNAYATIDDLYSIIKKISKTCKRIPFYVYEVKNTKDYNVYRLMQQKVKQNPSAKNIWDVKDLQTKSLEIIGEDDELQKILDNPNSTQSKDEFLEAAYTFPLLTGNDYIWLNALSAGANSGKLFSETGDYMIHLPPDYTQPVVTRGLPHKITSYQFVMNGIKILETLDVLHRKYFNPIYDINGNELVGLSPLRAANKTLTQIGNERDYANRSLINAGAEGFISIDEEGYAPASEVFGQLKTDLLTELGTVRDRSGSNLNAKKLAVILGNAKYNKIGISPADMMLVEQGKITFEKLCNIYGISDILFNNNSASTESNVKEMVKQMYTNVVLPEVMGLRDMLQKGLAWRYPDKQRVIDLDMSDITELQEDENRIADKYAALPCFKPNDVRESLGYGRDLGEEGERLIIKQGYSLYDDVVAPLDLTNTDNLKYNDYER